MKNFIKGILFISLLLPILNGIVSIFNYFIDFIDMNLTYKISEIQKKMPKQEGEESQAIGFQFPVSNNEEGE